MKIVMDKRFAKKLARKIESYTFDVGVIEDKPHRLAQHTPILGQPNLGLYAGGPVRKATRENSGKSIGDVLVENMERIGKNILVEPFKDKSSDMMKFTKAFLTSAFANKTPNRIKNLLQAVVRNPILKGEYGPNSAFTADAKGFDRHLIDTGQTFKAIKARVNRV